MKIKLACNTQLKTDRPKTGNEGRNNTKVKIIKMENSEQNNR